MAGPYYWAWVDASETVFGLEHLRYDEAVFSAVIEGVEGDIDKLTVEIRNPRMGLLAPGRQQHVWFSRFDEETETVEPLFFGHVVAIPSNVFLEVITVVFTCKPPDYLEQKQKVAGTLKVRPFYDPVFLDVQHRDDPDAILEGYTRLWTVDRVSRVVSTSDIIVGEDGLVDFTEHDAFYDSVSMTITQNPEIMVRMEARVGWTQATTGVVDLGAEVKDSYSGDGIVSEWPRPGAGLGGGWYVRDASAVDIFGIQKTLTASWSWSFQNREKIHNTGDTMTVNESNSEPQLFGPVKVGILSFIDIAGLVDPYAVDADGDPAPINTPGLVSITYMYVPLYRVRCSLSLEYRAKRQRTEYLSFTLTADLQGVIESPVLAQDSEIITLSGADVGVPLVNIESWLDVAGLFVHVGQIVAPDAGRIAPGGTMFQICTQAGVTGTVEPIFSDFAGVTTSDGGAVWTSLGTTSIGEPPDWAQFTLTPPGKLIIPQLRTFENYASLVLVGTFDLVPVGVDISLYTIVYVAGTYQICILAGVTTPGGRSGFSGTYGAITVDGTVEWQSLGVELPQGTSCFMAMTSGTTGNILPNFNVSVGQTVIDGGVHWLSLGLTATFLGIPIGGTPGNVIARSYFPTDRGLWSVEYLIAVARAHLLNRARAVRVGWDCTYQKARALTNRKNARLFEPRMPGGVALGKVVAYKLDVNGDAAREIGHVEVACCIGRGAAVETVTGDPTYVAEGYFETGEVQQYVGQTIVLPGTTDIGYAPPVAGAVDDGLQFPLDASQVVITNVWHGSLEAQEAAIDEAFIAARQANGIQQISPGSFGASISQQQTLAILGAQSVDRLLKLNAIWKDLRLKPIDAGPFQDDYEIVVTQLQVPKQIDLEAPSME